MQPENQQKLKLHSEIIENRQHQEGQVALAGGKKAADC